MLLRKKNNKLTKREYWEKLEFFDLIKDLHTTEKLLSEYSGGSSGKFLSAEEFHTALVDKIDDIEFGNQTDLSELWIWFASTCAWDDFVGEEGQELGNRIFARLDKWWKGNK
ncbi:hypothetical protein DMA11_09735 [Marinilabiliaceae bacterium JC017]|nr:hypothetical protein DMA11_09735 [Marinilabiliaceae bacterium JC017]